MMYGTVITEENADAFLPAVGDYALMNSDVFLGVIDEESDTACGVLAAEAIGEHVLAIRWIYVAESMRRRGAGKELVSSLQELAGEIGAEAIVCSCDKSDEDDNAVAALLNSCSFAEGDKAVPVFSYKIEDMDIKQEGTGKEMILPLGEVEDDELYEIEQSWKDDEAYGPRLSHILMNRALYDQKLSLMAYDRMGEAIGIIAVNVVDKEVRIEDFYVRGGNSETTGQALLQSLIRRVEKMENARIVVTIENMEALFALDQWSGGKGEKTGEIAQMSFYFEL